jgi:hypothetical protein
MCVCVFCVEERGGGRRWQAWLAADRRLMSAVQEGEQHASGPPGHCGALPGAGARWTLISPRQVILALKGEPISHPG